MRSIALSIQMSLHTTCGRVILPMRTDLSICPLVEANHGKYVEYLPQERLLYIKSYGHRHRPRVY